MKRRRLQRIATVMAALGAGFADRWPPLVEKNGTGAYRKQRAPELVCELQTLAERKRRRKASTLQWNAVARDSGYFRAKEGLQHCFHDTRAS